MKAYLDSGKKLSELRDEIQIYPQALVNARVDNAFKATALEDGEVKEFIADIEAKMEGTGRSSNQAFRNRATDQSHARR